MGKIDGRLRYGMVGGGEGSFIGDVHRKAASFDGQAELVAGCFSRDYDNTMATGKKLRLDNQRLYQSYEEMAREEAGRQDGIDYVSIVTPNHLHYAVARAFLKQGINVVCDKPLTFTVSEARELAKLVEEKDLLFCVTYTYSGYPMVKQAREIISRGEIGEIRTVMGEYPQEWLATPLEETDNKQASWRTDPQFSGKSNCVGDIGSHIEHTVSYITGLEIKSLLARLDIFGERRQLDDNASIMINYQNGATGLYWCSQVAYGNDNGLKVRVFGSKGALEWEQEKPNYLQVTYHNQPKQILSRGRDQLHAPVDQIPRIPAGHPEGYYEAFANLYRAFSEALLTKKSCGSVNGREIDFPNLEDGINGVRFINLCVESSRRGAEWVKFE